MYKRPLVLSNGRIEELQTGDVLDQSAIIVGPIGPTGPSGPAGASGPQGATGPGGTLGSTVTRFLGDSPNQNGATLSFNPGFVGTCQPLGWSPYIYVGYADDWTECVSITSNFSLTTPPTLVGMTALVAVDLGHNFLTTAQVNSVLSQLVANGASNGMLSVGGQIPFAPPSGQGLTDVETLQARGWTVSVDPSANMATVDVNAALSVLANLSGMTVNLAGMTPSAPPSGQGVTDLCRARANGCTISVDPFTGLAAADIDAMLTSLLSVFPPVPFDVTQVPAVALDNAGIALIAELQTRGWNITAPSNPNLTSSDVTEILDALVASGSYGGHIDVSNNTPPATPVCIADIIILTGRGWTVTTDPQATSFTTTEVDAILATLVASNIYGNMTALYLGGCTPSNQAIADQAFLNSSGWIVTLDARANLATSDVDAILNGLLNDMTVGGYRPTYGGFLDVSGNSPAAPPTPDAGGTYWAAGLVANDSWTIITD